MAEALVVGSFLSAFLQVLFDRMASRRVVNFFGSRKISNRLMEKLKVTMNSVEGVLDDAEEKEITRPAVKRWVDELKDAFYEADDLLDEIVNEAMRSELELDKHRTRLVNKVRKYFLCANSFEKDMQAKLEEILEKLNYLVEQKDALGLREGRIAEKPSSSSSKRVPTTSRVDESGVFGREGDKEVIMKMLLSNSDHTTNNGSSIGVVSVVGMGGVGKTTLAQLIYNDKMISLSFDLKAWVYVSEDFDVFKITRDILKELFSVACDGMTQNQLQVDLEKQLANKKFLLILDDVWNENYIDWDILRTPFRSGAPGSKVLVTTRSHSVASIMSPVLHIHTLDALADYDCWPLFSKHAFVGGTATGYPHLAVIGKQIVKKCKGLPLAVKTLGGLLHSRRNVEDWEKILENSIWDSSKDNILPALRLSYFYLPSYLKRCFAYCSIFPKDYEFDKEELILLWEAEGFLVHGNKGMKEVGEEYFDELVSSSFFQRMNDYSRSRFVMHDLLNDLARTVAGEYCFSLAGKESQRPSQRTRHLSIVLSNKDASEQLLHLLGSQPLHTFLPVHEPRRLSGYIDNKVVHELLPQLQRLRVLSLSPCKNVVEVPDSVGRLKHLRLLDFSQMSIMKLPESLCNLYSLEILKLKECDKLVQLPSNFEKLINMYHLDIEGTKFQKMPPNLGKLKKLQKLDYFIVGRKTDGAGCGIKELGKFQCLQGSLAIRSLQNISNVRDALDANLGGKRLLKKLTLEWKRNGADGSQHEKDVLEGLQPYTDVESISIIGYGGTSFPNWVGDSSFTRLASLRLIGLKYCSSLPALGQLASLQELSIVNLSGIMVIGPEFYGSYTPTTKPFQSLKSLWFHKMPQWQEWVICGDEVEGGAFPLLQELCIAHCPQLKVALPRHLPCLTRLEITECPQLVASLPRAPNIKSFTSWNNSCSVQLHNSCLTLRRFRSQYNVLEQLEKLRGGLLDVVKGIRIEDCDSLKLFPLELFPKLRSLEIRSCQNFESLSLADADGPHNLTHHGNGAVISLSQIEMLDIWDCPNFVSFFPNGGGGGGGLSVTAPNMTKLRLTECSKLESLPQYMHSMLPSLEEVSLTGCPEIGSFPERGLPSRLKSIGILNCNKLIAGRMQWNMQKQHLPSLWRFEIGCDENVESFPEETLLPFTLTSLVIRNLQNLKSLDYTGLCRLSSLQKLAIYDCPELHSVPEQGLPFSTLTSLAISNTPLLDALINKGCCRILASLKEMEISSCSELLSLPMHWLPCTLTVLDISNLQNLQFLQGLEQLTVLQKLKISRCPVLQSMPEERLPSSLSHLYICECPHLQKRCRKQDGEDWPKISHIRRIVI